MASPDRFMAQCAEVGLIVGQAVHRQRLHGHLGLEIWFARSSEILSHHRYPESLSDTTFVAVSYGRGFPHVLVTTKFSTLF